MSTKSALLALALSMIVGNVRAEVLGTWSPDAFIGASTPDLTEMGIRFGAGSDVVIVPDAELFEGLVFTENDVGSTFVATSATDPDFDSIVTLLTDGKSGFVQLCREIPSGTGCPVGSTEQQAFQLGSVDFAGTSIDKISMTIDLLEFKSPGYKGATDIDLVVTFTMEGTTVATRPPSWSLVKSRF